MKIRKLGFLVILTVVFFSGCATARTVSFKDSPAASRGIYHTVKSRETLWSIAKGYGVSVEEIVKANHIPNAAHIERGQLILIPGATTTAKIVSSQEAFEDDEFQWPIKGKVVSYFGDKKTYWTNNGIDIRSSFGKEVYPARGGEVVFADFLSGYGYAVIVDHGDSYDTVYAQNSEILVSIGDFVTKKVPVAKVGGDDSLAFLHFEVRKNSIASNPLYFLPR
ncbi:MAG: peptidoglycan DD-metalloendopeptidase family protein [Candidatus Aceula meridiana]|nr:peptidoglycan DD-metalloendopeptidase family protein [Candidatus Aceula meridiana]